MIILKAEAFVSSLQNTREELFMFRNIFTRTDGRDRTGPSLGGHTVVVHPCVTVIIHNCKEKATDILQNRSAPKFRCQCISFVVH